MHNYFLFCVYLTVSQDPRVLNNDVFNGFLVFAQNETQRAGGGQDEVPIDIYLTSGQKVTLTIPATLQTDDLLEVGSSQIPSCASCIEAHKLISR